MQNEPTPEEVRKRQLKTYTRLFKMGCFFLVTGIFVICLYSIGVSILKDYSATIHTLYMENQATYAFNRWCGVIIVAIGAGMMIHAKILERKCR